MSNELVYKKNFWKNFASFWVLLLIILSIFLLNIKIGFSIFELFGG